MKKFYCIPGMHNSDETKRVYANKANYFSEKFNYNIYIITTKEKIHRKIKKILKDNNLNILIIGLLINLIIPFKKRYIYIAVYIYLR